MLKRIVSILLVLVVLGMLPLVAGCAKDEMTTETQFQSEDRVVSQEEVVE